jgi:hypothetical protein
MNTCNDTFTGVEVSDKALSDTFTGVEVTDKALSDIFTGVVASDQARSDTFTGVVVKSDMEMLHKMSINRIIKKCSEHEHPRSEH